MTIWFSFQRYNLLDPAERSFAGLENYTYLLTDPSLGAAIWNTLLLVGWVLVITVGLGTLLAVLLDQDFWGRGIARVLVIAPFFVMPTVSALIWKNLLMHPVNGLFGFLLRSVGLSAVDWFADLPLGLHHHHRRLAVAALRHPHPAHLGAVARPASGRRRRAWTAPAPSPCSSSSSCRTWPAPSAW